MAYQPDLSWDQPARCVGCGGRGTVKVDGRVLPCTCPAGKPYRSDLTRMADWPGGIGDTPDFTD